MGQPVKISELARTMIRLSGLSVRDEHNMDGDIAIEEIGLRPGEKLYEELLIGGEHEETLHPRILKAHEAHLDMETLEGFLDQLFATRDAYVATQLLSKIVPEFCHSPLGQQGDAISIDMR